MLGTAATVTGAGYAGYKVYQGGENIVSKASDIKIDTKKETKKASTIVFHAGTLQSTFSATLGDATEATENALKDKLTIYKKDQTDKSTSFKAVTTMSEKVQLELTESSTGQTDISIRVGDGNMSQSKYIHGEIARTINLNRIKKYEVAK